MVSWSPAFLLCLVGSSYASLAAVSPAQWAALYVYLPVVPRFPRSRALGVAELSHGSLLPTLENYTNKTGTLLSMDVFTGALHPLPSLVIGATMETSNSPTFSNAQPFRTDGKMLPTPCPLQLALSMCVTPIGDETKLT